MANGRSNGNGNGNGNNRRNHLEKERGDFKALLAENPNYFATAPETGQKAVVRIRENTKYEELSAIGFYPELDLLEAIIDVKLDHGYRGTPGTAGSAEYVRFFIDWDGDGDYLDPDEDVGIVSVNVQDIQGGVGTNGESKSHSFALHLKTSFPRKPCKTPKLFKVRAILSWEDPPPAGDPEYQVVWGNVLEKWVQFRPSRYRIRDILSQYDLHKLKFSPAMLELDMPISRPAELTVNELAELYRDDDVPEHRYNFPAIREVAHRIRKYPSALTGFRQDPQFPQMEKSVAAVLKAKPSTRYEELRSLGLNYDLDQLSAVVTVKMPSGYNGDLCTTGSYEYVAFWLQVHDEIEQLCSWRYVGTACVNVHDIKPVPIGGLQYAVYLPVDLSEFRENGSRAKVLKVRAVLSWNAKPDPAEPEQLPVWGNRADVFIRVKPGEPIAPGEQQPLLTAVGNMAVESIAGNVQSMQSSLFGAGYANGVSLSGGFFAVESPFGGRIAISGRITHPPGNPAPADKLKYKVQYKKCGCAWKDIRDDFQIWLRNDGVQAGTLDQAADADGYFRYQADDALSSASPLVEVQDNLLAVWHTPVADGDGLYLLRLLLHAPGTPPRHGVPEDHLASNVVKVMIDNTAPVAAISLDMESCQEVRAGDDVVGKFTATDSHLWQYAITVLPASVEEPPVLSPARGQYPVLPGTGVAGKAFAVATDKETTPCNYVLRLWVWDRVIVDNQFPGHRAQAETGFCLGEEE